MANDPSYGNYERGSCASYILASFWWKKGASKLTATSSKIQCPDNITIFYGNIVTGVAKSKLAMTL